MSFDGLGVASWASFAWGLADVRLALFRRKIRRLFLMGYYSGDHGRLFTPGELLEIGER
jgi:hypothetical protein